MALTRQGPRGPVARRLASTLPGGIAPVAAGLIVLGITAYGFLIVAARSLGAERYAPLAVLWALVFLIGPGVFVPLEQELARAISARQATGRTSEHLVRMAALAGTLLLGPRLGKYDDEGRPVTIPGHNMPLAVLGVCLLHI